MAGWSSELTFLLHLPIAFLFLMKILQAFHLTSPDMGHLFLDIFIPIPSFPSLRIFWHHFRSPHFFLWQIIVCINFEMFQDVDVEQKTILADLDRSLMFSITVGVLWTLVGLAEIVGIDNFNFLQLLYNSLSSLADCLDDEVVHFPWVSGGNQGQCQSFLSWVANNIRTWVVDRSSTSQNSPLHLYLFCWDKGCCKLT